MLPAFFVFLDSLPMTPNGKLDRKALPAPDQSRPELEEIYVAPRTALEEKLAKIWREVLKLETVGVHDNFFCLGGHSLLATQVVSRIRQSHRIELPLRTIFEAPTIEKMAAVITEHQARTLGQQDLDHILGELESMSDTEAKSVKKAMASEP
jgi:acyl carrier protein